MKAYSFGQPAPRPLEAPSEEAIVGQWKSDELVVSIICAAYEHEFFIDDALNGFLAQETDFRFEVIVRDDCSSDRTADIIREYERKYPKIVRGIYEPFNKWPAVKAGAVLRKEAKGKYVAQCDGDDYWIDRRKLQKQVDYLDSHRDVVLVKTRAIWIEDGVISASFVEGGTRTNMFRNAAEIPANYTRFIYFGDTYYQSYLRQYGKFALINDETAVWRKHSNGIFGSLVSKDERVLNLHRSQTQAWIAQQFLDEGKSSAANRHRAESIQLLLRTMTLNEIISVIGILTYSSLRKVGGKVLRLLHLKNGA